MRILRTEAEDVGEGGLLTVALFAAFSFYTIKTGSAALSPRWRCGDGSAASLLRLLLLFVLFGFHQVFVPGYFFGLVHNFSPVSGNLATARVATTIQPSSGNLATARVATTLLFGFVAAFKIDLCHLVSFVSTVVVFVIVTEFVVVFAIITQHRIFDIRTNSISTAL